MKSVRKELKTRKREHPALFMLGAVGKHLYEAVQASTWMSIALKYGIHGCISLFSPATRYYVDASQEQYKKAGKTWKLKKWPPLILLAAWS